MRVLSAMTLPPLRALLGSTASTATRCPLPTSITPKLSMKALLPTPGTPVMPSRTALPVFGRSRPKIWRATAWWAGSALSISVMVLESMRRSPARTPAT